MTASPVEIPPDELVVRFSRSSGPGGQNVNMRATRVEVLWDVDRSRAVNDEQRERIRTRLAGRLDAEGRLRVASSAGRTQEANRRAAESRLRRLVAEALRPPPPARRPTRPSKAAAERRIAEKKARGALKRQRAQADEE